MRAYVRRFISRVETASDTESRHVDAISSAGFAAEKALRADALADETPLPEIPPPCKAQKDEGEPPKAEVLHAIVDQCTKAFTNSKAAAQALAEELVGRAVQGGRHSARRSGPRGDREPGPGAQGPARLLRQPGDPKDP
jgi:hypothetical protein